MTALAGDVAEAEPTPVEAAESANRCANCHAARVGPYCHACGQKGRLHGRLWHMIEDVAQGLAQFDGRFWRTLPLLAFNPGRLSRDWREGRRVRYLAPLNVFLFAVFLFFLIPDLAGQRLINLDPANLPTDISDVRFDIGGGEGETAEERAQAAANAKAMEERIQRNVLDKLKAPELLQMKMEDTAKNLAIFIVPESVLILALLLAFRGGFTLYDHTVVSLYGLGALTLLIVAAMLLGSLIKVVAPASDVQLGGWVFLIAAIHAVRHLKGAYALSWTGAVVRGLILGVLSIIGFGVFVLSVVILGFMA